MCCDNKCFFFINVRTGSLIFGYINAIITGFGVLGCLCAILALLTTSLVYRSWDSRSSSAIIIIYVAVCLFQLSASFSCTVLLLFGIAENKPVLVKTFVIYGMLQLVILLAVMIILFITCLPVFGVVMFLGCCVYLSLIYMVYLTYKGMIVTNPPNLLMATA